MGKGYAFRPNAVVFSSNFLRISVGLYGFLTLNILDLGIPNIEVAIFTFSLKLKGDLGNSTLSDVPMYTLFLPNFLTRC